MHEKLAIEGGQPRITSPIPTIKDASGRSLGEEEKQLVLEVLDSGCLAYIYGSKVGQFEKRFAEILGSTHAVSVSSGTAALHAALIYLNPEPGDEVLVSPITDMGSIIPILYQLAIPVFVDIDPLNQNMDPRLIEEAISPRTRAIVVTHIFGGPAEMDPIMKIARKHNLFVIEDCAQAHLTRYRGRYVGTIGDIGCFSFQQSKHITTGDGGMLIADRDGQFGRLLRHCHDKGWPRDRGGRDHLFLAPNYHMTELQAAVGLAQIEKYNSIVESRRLAAKLLHNSLADFPCVEPIGVLSGCRETYFYYCFRIQLEGFRVDGEQIVEALKAEGLYCELGYPGPVPIYAYPVIRQKKTFGSSGWPFNLPSARKKWDYPPGLCPEAEKACCETVVLPWNEKLNEKHVELIAAAILKVLTAYRT